MTVILTAPKSHHGGLALKQQPQYYHLQMLDQAQPQVTPLHITSTDLEFLVVGEVGERLPMVLPRALGAARPIAEVSCLIVGGEDPASVVRTASMKKRNHFCSL